MNRGQRDHSADAPDGGNQSDGGSQSGGVSRSGGAVPVERGACRDLVRADRYAAVWIGVRTGDDVVTIATAGNDDHLPADQTLSLDAVPVVEDAVDSGEIRVRAESVVTDRRESVGTSTARSTVVVPFWGPNTKTDDNRPDGVLVVSLADDDVEDASDLPAGERNALEATARTVGRHRSQREHDTDESDGSATTGSTRFREAFQRHDAVMLLIDPDDGTIRDANDAAVSFYGYAESTLIGQPIQEINAASRAEVARERTRASGEERNYFVFDHELASGERRTVEVHSTPIPLADGPVLFSVIHDVTEQSEYEAELERYGDLFENIPVGLFRTRPGSDGVFEAVNPALVELFGADSERDLVGRRPSDLYPDTDERDVFSEQLLEAGVLEEWEHELQRLDGESFWASVSAIRTETPDGPVFDGIVQDVSDRKAYQQSLEERNERMEVLNQLLRHDIRNDMAVIGGSLDLLGDHLDDEGRERLDTLRSRVDHVVELTHTARNITETLSVESEETMETAPIRLDQVLADEMENARSSFPEAEFSLSDDVPAVSVAGTELLDSVFRNLFNNAVQHNDAETPVIHVETETDAETVTVEIADNGPGIPEGQKESIFERGEKGQASSGTGLGLYLVGALVDQYDGKIAVEDNDPEGAVFRVTFRRADDDSESESTDVFGGVAE